MRKNNHSVMAQEVTYLISQINKLTEEEVHSLYGIELSADGKVYDTTYDKKFDSINEWAMFNIEQDDVEYEEHFYDKGMSDF